MTTAAGRGQAPAPRADTTTPIQPSTAADEQELALAAADETEAHGRALLREAERIRRAATQPRAR